MSILQAFLVNWYDFVHALVNMQAPPAEIHFADDVTISIQAFEDTLYNAIKKFRHHGRGWSIFVSTT